MTKKTSYLSKPPMPPPTGLSAFPINFRVDKAVLKKFDAYCKRLGIERSSMFRQLMTAFVDANERCSIHNEILQYPIAVKTLVVQDAPYNGPGMK